MTVVIADTSPINYLVLIGEIALLRKLYHRVIIPAEVLNELIDVEAPACVREWATHYPNWLEVRKVLDRGFGH